MKAGIHPKYEQTTIRCACGAVIETGSTKKDITVEICSKCHPFYTGKQKLVDTSGRVDKFNKKYGIKPVGRDGGSVFLRRSVGSPCREGRREARPQNTSKTKINGQILQSFNIFFVRHDKLTPAAAQSFDIYIR